MTVSRWLAWWLRHDCLVSTHIRFWRKLVSNMTWADMRYSISQSPESEAGRDFIEGMLCRACKSCILRTDRWPNEDDKFKYKRTCSHFRNIVDRETGKVVLRMSKASCWGKTGFELELVRTVHRLYVTEDPAGLNVWISLCEVTLSLRRYPRPILSSGSTLSTNPT